MGRNPFLLQSDLIGHQANANGLVGMQAVFSLIIDGRVRAIHDRVRDLLIAVGGQGMHVDGVGIGQLKVVVIDAPGIFELLAILQILFSGDGVRAPALCIDDDGILVASFRSWVISSLAPEEGATLLK